MTQTTLKTSDLKRAKLATSVYTFSANGRTFSVVWNWKNGADRWHFGEMDADTLAARVEKKDTDGIGEGRTLDLVKKGIVEMMAQPAPAEGKKAAKRTRAPRSTESRKPRRTRKAADAEAAEQAVLDAAQARVEEYNNAEVAA